MYSQQACRAHAYTTYIYIYTYYIYIYTGVATQFTDRLSKHSREYIQHHRPPPAPLSGEQNGSPPVGTCICTRWVPPAADPRHLVCYIAAPRFQSSQLLAPGLMMCQGHSSTPTAGTDDHVNRWPELSRWANIIIISLTFPSQQTQCPCVCHFIVQ